MNAATFCPQCQAPLEADSPLGLCPKCVLQLGMEPQLRNTAEAAAGSGDGFEPPTAADLARHFPQLEILELIGHGGMGAVYKARQTALDRVVALKILPPSHGQDPSFAERFAREARALARLTHPNIVIVFEFGEADGYFYLIMEYIDGVNLRGLMRQGQLAPGEALAIVPQICEALQYAHDEGVVHRDIKPENVLVDKKGRIKIADFGLAKLLGRTALDQTLTGTRQVMGTLHYMAPEQMEKPATVDHRADIYSLGVVFYELLTGELPLGRFDPPSIKAQVDAALDRVVLRALEKEPARRYQHASDIKTEVESVSRGAAPPRTPPRGDSLRVPFYLQEHIGGGEKAQGILRCDGQTIALEYQEKSEWTGKITSKTRQADIPVDELIDARFTQNWLVSTLRLQTDKLDTLENVPLAAHGSITLYFRRADRDNAARLWAALQKLQRSNAWDVDAIDETRDARPVEAEADLDWVRRQVRGPANGLLAVGLVDLCCVIAIVVFTILQFTARPAGRFRWSDFVGQDVPAAELLAEMSEAGTDRFEPDAPVLILLITLAAVTLLCVPTSSLLILASLKMRHLQLLGLGAFASVVAMLPIHPGCLLGLPFGIWSLMVLLKPEVRHGFAAAARRDLGESGRRDDRPPPEAKPPLPHDERRLNWQFRLAGGLLIAAAGLPAGVAVALMVFLGGTLGALEILLVAGFVIQPVLMFASGLAQLLRRFYGLALAGAVIAVLPLSVIWPLTCPCGVFALVILISNRAHYARDDA